jgi:hypothetical protein
MQLAAEDAVIVVVSEHGMEGEPQSTELARRIHEGFH